MHFSFLANIALSAACLVWLSVSAYYLFHSYTQPSKTSKQISLILGLHGILIAVLALFSMFSLPHFVEALSLKGNIPQMISGIAALTLGMLSISWLLPKVFPDLIQREKDLETSLSDTTSHLKSLYSMSNQGVMLICADTFKVLEVNHQAQQLLSLTPSNRASDIPEAIKEHLTSWLQNKKSSNLLNIPSKQGTLTLSLDISSFAMEQSQVLLVQLRDIETLPEDDTTVLQLEHQLEVQLIEHFDELLNIKAESPSELIANLAIKLTQFNVFDSIAVLEHNNGSDQVSYAMLSGQALEPFQALSIDAFESRILDTSAGIQLYSRASELKLPAEITTQVRNNSALTIINLSDQVSNSFSLVLFTRSNRKLNSAVLALIEQLRTQLIYRISHLGQHSIQKQNNLLQQQLTSIIESSANAIILTNTDFMIEYINPKLCETSGYEEQQLIGRPFNILCPIEDNPLIHRSIREHVSSNKPWYGEVVQRDQQGHLRWSNLQLTFMHDEQGNVSHYIMHLEDRTELYQAQDEINQLTHFDPLTNLPNRSLLTLRLQSVIEENFANQITALMYLDLDGFKHINDSLGHHNGDRLLKQIAERLSDHLGTEDTLARLGGDEFAILIPNILAKGSIVNLVSSILDTISLPTLVADNSVVLTGSIGITLYPQDAESIEELQKNADLAMYQAKKELGNSFHIYTPELNTQAVTRLEMEHRLRDAIQNEKLDVYFQPQVDIASGDIIGAEALVRWIDPERGAIPPDQFIPLAEETGLIATLGNWVLHQSCSYTRQFMAHVKGPFKVAINLSGYQFKRQDQLLEELELALLTNTLPPECIELELTESMLMDNVQSTKDTLHKLHDRGISIAIDDFGTGYSSLSYLKEFPIDKLKVDRSFIRDVNHNQDDAAITTAVIAMAHKLGLSVLAEGVENTSQLQFLIDHKCNYMQGYYFSKPIPAGDMLEMLAEQDKTPDLLKGLN